MTKRSLLPILLLLFSIPVYSQFTTRARILEDHVHYLASDQLLGRGFGSPPGKVAADYTIEELRAVTQNDSFENVFRKLTKGDQ